MKERPAAQSMGEKLYEAETHRPSEIVTQPRLRHPLKARFAHNPSRALLAHPVTSMQGKPEPDAEVPEAQVVPVAIRGAAVPGVVVPAPAPNDPVRARKSSYRIGY